MANSQSSPWNLPAGRSAIDDPSSQYFLHHSDNPGLVLVSQPLTSENYASWSRAMKIALSVKNKLGFVDGSISKPSENDPNLLNAWIRNNNIVVSWLLNSVSKDIAASILFAESATEIWNDLHDRFQQSNGPTIFQLRRDLINLRQEQDPVSVYFTKLKALWEELNHFRPLCNCGKCICNRVKKIEEFVQMDYTMMFLMGLNDSFAQVRSQVLLMDPLPPINRVFSLIIQEERKCTIVPRSISNPSTSEMDFMIKGDHSQATVSNRGPYKPQKGRPFCVSCRHPGCTVETCYKIHGYPLGYKSKTKELHQGNAAPVNQAFGTSVETTHPNIFQNIDKHQLEQLMTMFVQHLSTHDQATKSSEHTCNTSVSGQLHQDDDCQE
ncbi:uncharacterized protein [Henckelia pumila]|uniref:uncharacterized protein n=1 Tax=Henckelia pumila TaxID=405737 RepID=UPI003C6DC0FA